MKILKINGDLLIDLPQFSTIKDAVEHCVKQGFNLRGADLRGVDLRGANLSHANLYSANLREANLYSADLHSADLRGVDLSGANLRGANLSHANLRWADLRGAITQYCPRFGHFSKLGGRSCFYYKPIETEPNYIIVAGCFSGTLEEFGAACKKTYPNNPVQAYEPQIAYLKTILK